ncbi:CPBP family intramembrane metalloprotease [Falcatimonas sp. MSJ-15]|uniref:CPBP family intramembrane glutamic endopeptidase n=1 Tax=Falcatimonas sp. MSJ-15 TaxID=2841515 RepID=UPI001C10A0AA|nr:CPBP family intramembrane glutamic endopeptidase [Falcatimonas sp. MSJ-15]MBU5469043.1 CPBP family intramembrane metalloprotease [Falcatimonas sp. MSJ-15]
MKKKSVVTLVWRTIYPILIYLTITIIVQIIIYNIFAYQISSANPGITSDMLTDMLDSKVTKSAMMINVIAGVIIIPVLSIILKQDKKSREEKSVIVKKEEYIYPFLAGIFMCLGCNWLIDMSGIINIFTGFNEVADSLYGGSIIFEFIAMVIIAPLLEEILFRGIIFARLREYMSVKVAIVISALIFGIIHGNVVQGMYAFIIGICLAYIYERYNTLLAAVLFHMSANLMSVIMTECEPVVRFISKALVYNIIGVVCLVMGIIMLISINRHIAKDVSREEK